MSATCRCWSSFGLRLRIDTTFRILGSAQMQSGPQKGAHPQIAGWPLAGRWLFLPAIRDAGIDINVINLRAYEGDSGAQSVGCNFDQTETFEARKRVRYSILLKP